MKVCRYEGSPMSVYFINDVCNTVIYFLHEVILFFVTIIYVCVLFHQDLN